MNGVIVVAEFAAEVVLVGWVVSEYVTTEVVGSDVAVSNVVGS